MGYRQIEGLEVLVLLLCASQSVLCLDCFVCNSVKDEACATTPPPDQYLFKCSYDTREIHPQILPKETPPLSQNSSDVNPTVTPTQDLENANNTPPFMNFDSQLPKEATFCRKTSYHIPAQNNGEQNYLPATVRVLRSCGWIPDNETKEAPASSCKSILTDGIHVDLCVCTGDGCNRQ